MPFHFVFPLRRILSFSLPLKIRPTSRRVRVAQTEPRTEKDTRASYFCISPINLNLFHLLVFSVSPLSNQPRPHKQKVTDPCIFIRHSPQQSRLFHLIRLSLHTSPHTFLILFLFFFSPNVHPKRVRCVSTTCALF